MGLDGHILSTFFVNINTLKLRSYYIILLYGSIGWHLFFAIPVIHSLCKSFSKTGGIPVYICLVSVRALRGTSTGQRLNRNLIVRLLSVVKARTGKHLSR